MCPNIRCDRNFRRYCRNQTCPKVSSATLLFFLLHPQNFARCPQEKIPSVPMGGCAGVRAAVVTWAIAYARQVQRAMATFDGIGSDNIEGWAAGAGVKCRKDEIIVGKNLLRFEAFFY